MSPLVLTLRAPVTLPLDLGGLTPEALAGRAPGEIERLPLGLGNTRLPLGELLAVEAGDASHLVLQGSGSRLDAIGRGMRAGRITVEGDAGAWLGAGMRAGRIEVRGSAGAFAAAALRGGVVRIAGSVGDFLAGCPVGERFGMRGGTVIVQGAAGDRAGDRMRRGVILIAGDVGDWCASRMVAGTLVLGGRLGDYPGFGMRRGTLLLRRPPARLLPTFADGGRHDLPFLRLLASHLREEGVELGPFGRPRRLTGDRAADGKGEILIADEPA